MRTLQARKPFDFKILEIEPLKPQQNQVLVEVKACGLCGTDLHLARDAGPEYNPLGHEISAVVLEVGTGNIPYRPGDTVIVEDVAQCGICDECKSGRTHRCRNMYSMNDQSGMSEMMTVDYHLLDPYDGIPWDHATLVEPAAVAYKNSWNLGSRLIFEDGTMYHPYIARESASKSDRPYWSALVREVWPKHQDQNCLCIFAGDFKKRVWNHVKVGPLGNNTPVYLLDPDRHTSQNLIISWQKLLDTLDFVEEVYDRGFSKSAIAENLYTHYSAMSTDFAGTLELEKTLSKIRHEPEFKIAILIAQRKE